MRDMVQLRRYLGGSMPDLHDLREFGALARVNGLRLSPDGNWLAAAVQTVSGDGKKHVSSIWRIDAQGSGAPARLTRSAEGETDPHFLPDGSLLFISKRPEPTAPPADDDADGKPALWLLPAAGGEASRIAAPPGGVAGVAAARNAGDVPAVLIAAPAFPGTVGADEDAKRRKARKDAGVSAILHEAGRVRYWDHDLGPDCLRLLACRVPGAAGLAE